MKKLIKHQNTHYLYLCFLIMATTCGAQDLKKTNNFQGAFQMVSQNFKGKDYDTTFTKRLQLKIYAFGYMMYVRVNPGDAVSAFGIGTYSTKPGELTENVIYSATDTKDNTNSFSGTVNINTTTDGYIQVIPEIMSHRGKIRLTEKYRSIDPGPVSPIDGAWKEVSAYIIHQKDTTVVNDKKYKIYYKGSFVSGSFHEDTLHKKHTIIAFGKFATWERNIVRETITSSTLPETNGHVSEINIIMKGSDAYTEITRTKNGFEEVAIYQRLK